MEPEPSTDTIRKIIHDLNGELFLIRGNAELALDEVSKDSLVYRNLNQIMERTDALSALASRLRAKQTEHEPATEK